MNRVFVFVLLTGCACFSAQAQTNYAYEGGIYGPESIFGYDDPSTLSSIGNIQLGNTYINDGVTAAPAGSTSQEGYSYHVDDWGQPDGSYGEVGVVFSLPVAATITEVTFYDASFFDGGWFGVSGVGQDGTNDNDPGVMSASALIAPALQVTYSSNPTSSNAVWTTVADHNNYVDAMTGITMPAPFGLATSTASTFTLDSAVTGITGIRLIGEVGGYSSNNGGFLGAYEFETPEPSTYALMLGGLAILGFCISRKASLRS